MRKNREHGFALVTTMVIGVTSIAFLLALATILTQAVHSVSANKWNESLRNAAEIGIEYAVNQYNLPTPCLLDQLGSMQLPANYLQSGNANSGIANVTVSLQITKLGASDWAYLRANPSSIYSSALDPYKTTGTVFTNAPASAPPPGSFIAVASPGGLRVLESTATNQIYSKTIRVILRARFDPIPGVLPPTPNQSFFSLPLLSNGILTVSPVTKIVGVNSLDSQAAPYYVVPPDLVHNIPAYNRFNLSVTTNTQAVISGQINGDVSVASIGSGAATVATVASNAVVNGRLLSNGVQSGVTGQTGPTPSGNVQAAADITPPVISRVSLNSTNPAASNQGLTQTTIASTPESVSAIELPTLQQQQLSNSSPIVGKDYSIPGFDTGDLDGPISITNNATPTRFFVDDPANAGTVSENNPNAAAINIQTSMLATQNDSLVGGARNLQIYYDGSLPVNITVDDGNFFALIYAPNAPVTLNGSGTFNGAIVGGTVNANLNGTMNLYTDLAIASKLQPSPGTLGSNWSPADIINAYNANQTAGVQYLTNSNGPSITGWQPVTWQEL